MPYISSTSTEADRQLLQQSAMASIPAGSIRALIHERTGVLPTQTQCQRLGLGSNKEGPVSGITGADCDSHVKQLRNDPQVSYINIYHHVDVSDLIAVRAKGRPKLKIQAEISDRDVRGK
jgi:hypothetical protein